MCRHAEELNARDVAVLVVTFQGGPLAEAYAGSSEVSWPVVLDETLSLYHAYGMQRGRWWDIWGPSTLWVYAKLILQGRRSQADHGDPSQLGGDVLIDPDGIVRMHHVGIGPADRPPLKSILDRIDATRS